MGATLVSNQVTIKINAAVSASNTSITSGSFTTVYTCPANSYSIVNIRLVPGTTNVSFRVGGQDISGTQTSAQTYLGVYVGPGQTVQANNPAVIGNAAIYVSGVEFTNSP